MNMIVVGLVIFSFAICRAANTCDDQALPQFQCKSDQKCIDLELTCNGRSDCADGSDEKFANCTDGCAFNGTLVKVGETGQDMEWWYTCTKSRWLISGCVNNGLRYKENESFQLITRQGVFWGKCEKLDRYHFMRQPYGCVDAFGRNVEAGKVFQLNQLFWAKCLLNRTNASVPEIGKVAVNEIKWKIEGCSDGTEKIIKDNEEFIWLIDPTRLLGVQIRCRVTKKEQEWPDVLPTACVVNANETKRGKTKPTFKLVKDKCYLIDNEQIYFCTITSRVNTPPPEAVGTVSTWSNDWLLNITENNAEEINQLKKVGFSECSETSKIQPVIPTTAAATIPASALSSAARPKRELKMTTMWHRVEKRSSRSLMGKVAKRISSDILEKTMTI